MSSTILKTCIHATLDFTEHCMITINKIIFKERCASNFNHDDHKDFLHTDTHTTHTDMHTYTHMREKERERN